MESNARLLYVLYIQGTLFRTLGLNLKQMRNADDLAIGIPEPTAVMIHPDSASQYFPLK